MDPLKLLTQSQCQLKKFIDKKVATIKSGKIDEMVKGSLNIFE